MCTSFLVLISPFNKVNHIDGLVYCENSLNSIYLLKILSFQLKQNLKALTTNGVNLRGVYKAYSKQKSGSVYTLKILTN